jgi:aconitate hydratase
MLALTFDNEADYDLIQEDDRFDFVDIDEFAPGKQLTLVINHKDGNSDTIKVNHSYNDSQIGWFVEGSALNVIKKENA